MTLGRCSGAFNRGLDIRPNLQAADTKFGQPPA